MVKIVSNVPWLQFGFCTGGDMESLLKDLRYSIRPSRKHPALTILIAFSLSLGIAATTTIFSVVYGILLAPPLYKNTNRLVVLWESNSLKGLLRTPVAPATFRDWIEGAHSFDDMELVAPGSPVTVTGSELPERANIQYATPGLFPLLGIRPMLGRFFIPNETKSTNPIILSYGFWRRRFAGNPDVIGQQLTINGIAQTVVGVLPRYFYLFDRDTDLWMPIERPDAGSTDHAFRSWLIAVGKLRSGVTLHSAQMEMNVLAQQIARAHPETNRDWGVKVEPIQEAQFGYWKPILLLLFGIVTFVLLISCANVANLLLSRLTYRNREFCLRSSLGASRARIVRQLLTEGILLGMVGGFCGWFLAHWGIVLFRVVAPSDFPHLQSVRISRPAFFFCSVVSILSGIAVAVIPAFFASRLNVIEILKSTSQQTTLGTAYRSFRNSLVVIEIALSFVLLFGAGLMINSMLRLLRVDPGFRSQSVITMQLFLSGPKYFEFHPEGVRIHEEVGTFYRNLLEHVSALAGVKSTGLVSWLPEMGYNTGRRERAFRIMRQRTDNGLDQPSAAFNAVSAGYFETLQIPLLNGRYFNAHDSRDAPWVAIVNEAFVHRYLSGADAIEKELRLDDSSATRRIVGVTGNVRQDALDEDSVPEIFVPYLQQPDVTSAHGYQNRVHMTVVVRTTLKPATAIRDVQQIAAGLDNSQPVFGARTMSEAVSESTSLRALYARLLELIASVALFLSAIGIYGVISHSIAQRTHEIGLRIAVGAGRNDVLRLVFFQGGKLILAGLGIGSVCALTLDRFLDSYLYGVHAADPMTMIACSTLLVAIALGAVWIPARRATRVDPIVALRYE